MSTKNTDLKTVDSSLPAHLQGAIKTTSVGNVDRNKLIIPRVKLMQMVSPEVTDFDAARTGEFWHTLAERSLGKEVKIVPVKMRRSYVLWAPRDDDRGILARAPDAVNWGEYANMEFTVKLKGVAEPVTYKLGKTVDERTEPGKPALSEFGSGIPGDPRSAPAAAETVEWMFLFPEFLELGPALVINTRTSMKPANLLISKIELRPIEHYGQQFVMGVTQEGEGAERYYNYKYTADGYADEATFLKAKEMFDYYQANADYEANDTRDDSSEGGHPRSGKPKGDASNNKF